VPARAQGREAFVEATLQFVQAADGEFGDEGRYLLAAADAMARALGESAPLREPNLNALVMGQDSVQPAVVVPLSAGAAPKADYASVSRTARSSSDSLNGLASQRQPLSSRKRSASVPATSPVTKMTRRASSGVAAAIAR